jgi:uncharacterized membrane protein
MYRAAVAATPWGISMIVRIGASRWMRIIATLAAALVIAGGSSAITYAVVHKPDTTVRDFNNGFSDSKLDDCQQGSASACAWLQHKG